MEITGKTKLICLLGSPIEHSISPQMHNEAFKMLELDYRYLAFDVNEKNLKTAVEGLKVLGVKGFNLTMPNKNLICNLLDDLSIEAKMTGAVNTVLNDNGKLIGYSTDGIGYMKALQSNGFDITNKKMTMIGAGGASSSICVRAALDKVSEIDIFSRQNSFVDRTLNIIENIKKYTDCKVNFYNLSDKTRLRQSIKESSILVNGTPVGMYPNTEKSVIDDISMFHKDLIVSDLIYNPKMTKFLKDAQNVGCKVINGLDMLLYQGAEAFKIWTGKEMPVEHIKNLYFE